MSVLERLREVFNLRAFAEETEDDDDEDNSTSNLSKPKTKNFLIPWLQTLEITSAELLSPTTTKITYRFPVTREYLNPMRTFHGGAIAAMFDVCTTWTLFPIADYGFWSTMGTTRSLVCTYVKPVLEGEVVDVECRIVHAGKRLCLLTGIMKREKDGAIVATCEHNKYNIDADESKM
ncbi:Thioesterase/thiol ester dehydrase-isomerase [Sphaerulina musiva SO2202]|uniref:Thioesterase/thiol ester dehydrase-isomerase n=1 Tax=Sphaerulina musiva (strain SO2202) TaxID=692275 RepID=N1QGD5_SPHMS|nr:Thioesterase/thiol ester dehydrase-isomerase [Sphaerulina musiva SO2202]EMF16251.1 Thioesterase/thiol ester dehydrase-isomerase [Sphaerulina musiva SO2202]